MCTRTRVADGIKLKGPVTTPLVTREQTPQPLEGMGDRKRAADLQPLVAAEVDGNPDRRALVAQRAAAVAAAGVVEGDTNDADNKASPGG